MNTFGSTSRGSYRDHYTQQDTAFDVGSKNETTWLCLLPNEVADIGWQSKESKTRKYQSQRLAVTEANVTWQICLPKSLSLYPYPYVVFKTQNAKQQHVSSEKRDFSRMFFVCFFICFLCLSANIVFWCRKLQNRHCKTFPAHFLLLWVPSSTKYMWYFRTAPAPASLQSFYRIVWLCFIALIVENTSTSKLQRTRWGGKVWLKCVQDVQVRLQSLKIAHLVTAWSLGGCWTWSEVWSYEHDEHVFCLGQFMPVQVCLISLILPFCILLFPFQNLFSVFFSHACSSWSFGNLWYVGRTTVVRGHRTP